MFSYRHAFHAGNHADVLKHITLVATLRYLMQKTTPLTLVDTHAGAGQYRLDARAARTSGEATEGIERLRTLLQPTKGHARSIDTVQPPDPIADYLSLVARFNPKAGDRPWRHYPGSPLLMYALMTEPGRTTVRDRLRLFEMHPTDGPLLARQIAQLHAGRQVTVTQEDGFAGLKALLPPPAAAGGSRRALVLMDPSYEIKSDYGRVAASIQDSLQRFATGVYLVWYPIIAHPEAHSLPRRLRTLAMQAKLPWLNATLNVGAAPAGSGLSASGMFVINPPHILAATLKQHLPRLLEPLSVGRGRGRSCAVDRG